MKTLIEHNKDVGESLQMLQETLSAGVLCPECRTELRFKSRVDKDNDLGQVRCPKCGLNGYKERCFP